MIRVTVELLPHGVGAPVLLGRAEIANDGTGDMARGNYNVRLYKSPRYASTYGVWKRGRVVGFDRRGRGPWDLLYLALRDTIGYRNRG